MNDYIFDKALTAIKKCQTRDPFKIAKELGIKVYYQNDFVDLKGMYAIIKRRRCIFLNVNLDEPTQKIVCAHEIGHDNLHRVFAKKLPLREFTLYEMKTAPEYEANQFAAHILLNEREIIELFNQGCDFTQAARELETNENLLLIKLRHMIARGMMFNLPYIPRSDFLGR